MISEQVDLVRQVFGLTATDLSDLLGTSRDGIYAMLSGDEFCPVSGSLIERMFGYALQFQGSGVELAKPRLVHRPILNGRSLFDILKSGEDLTIALPALKDLLEKEAQTRRSPKGSGKHLRSLEEVVDEF